MTFHPLRKTAAALLALMIAAAPAWAEPAETKEPDAGLRLECKSAILIEQSTGQVLYEMNADVPIPPASITKIMTLLLTFEAMEQGKFTYDTSLSCSEHAASMGGSQIWLEPGEQMTVDEILRATFISSANDAAVVLAEAVAGSEDAFVNMMNERAKALGMENTRFANATGLDAQEHYSTARDIALMSAALLQYPDVTRYSTVWMDSLRGGTTELVNTNKMVRFYKGATGLKTGTTNGAGSCLSASAQRENLSLIAVSLGSDTSAQRFASCRTLLDYGFANYITVQPPPLDDQMTPVPVLHGVQRQVELDYALPPAVVMKRGEEDSLTQQVQLAENVEAPVEKGQQLGKVVVAKAGNVLGEYPVLAKTAVERMDFGKGMGILFGMLLGKTE
ncbi:MAG: D-alanyl-D-alanine carboxypeptidase [Oscillospiraceae bacterium]|nr:D-alanyl-D-alanine carboxypeptidase [Oscillospiraceae bacterium]